MLVKVGAEAAAWPRMRQTLREREARGAQRARPGRPPTAHRPPAVQLDRTSLRRGLVREKLIRKTEKGGNRGRPAPEVLTVDVSKLLLRRSHGTCGTQDARVGASKLPRPCNLCASPAKACSRQQPRQRSVAWCWRLGRDGECGARRSGSLRGVVRSPLFSSLIERRGRSTCAPARGAHPRHDESAESLSSDRNRFGQSTS